MSFMKSLKGLADDFKDLMGDKDKDKKENKESKPPQDHGASESNRGASDSYYQATTQPQGQHYDQHQGQYNQPPSQYPQHNQYGSPPQHGYGGPPQSGPQLPPGWVQQWDQNSQRYYYLEQATGRSQWEPPVDHSRGYGGPPPQGYPPGQGYDQNRGYGQDQSGYGGHGFVPPVGAAHPGGSNFPHEAVKSGEKKKSGSKAGLLAAGAGGLVVGGLAGAALAGDSSDDEHHASHGGYPPAGYGAPAAGYGDPSAGYGAPPPGQDPLALEHNSDVSSSQRSSLESARKEYEEAQEAAADSDASSSDHEELEEAREDYEEEIEEAASDAED